MRRRALRSGIHLSRSAYRAFRVARLLELLASGDPERVLRRIRNRYVGRALARSGLWGRW